MKYVERFWFPAVFIVGVILGFYFGGKLLDRATKIHSQSSDVSEVTTIREGAGHHHGEMARMAHRPAESSGVLMQSEEGGLYYVRVGETLGEAMMVQSGEAMMVQGVATQEGPGKCYRDDINIPDEEREKNQWNTACKCHEVTQCAADGNSDAPKGEQRCKRHCRKSDCDCCAI